MLLSPVGAAAAQTVFATGLEQPMGITQLSDGRILVAEFGPSDQVSAFFPDGTPLGVFASGLEDPAGIAQLADGRVLVSEFNDARVQAFEANGTPLGTFVTDFGDNGRGAPFVISQATNGTVLISDNYAGAVRGYSPSGVAAGNFAESLSDPPGAARGVLRRANGSVLVTFTGPLDAVQQFGAAGGSGSVFATLTSGDAGQMVELADGSILALNWFVGEVRSFSSTGTDTGVVATLPDVLGGIVRLADGRVLVTTDGGTIYELGLDTALEAKPPPVSIGTVQPNPAQGTSTLSLTLTVGGWVTVDVLDRLGRIVAVAHEGPLSAGAVHAIRLDGSGLASGVYGVRVRAPEGVGGHVVSFVR
ncbi:MAG: hypothetical protein CMM85_11305 [Rhodothermaceae bacterium]|nr:hypothetical protein [Rhodothermaceae bacterium]